MNIFNFQKNKKSGYLIMELIVYVSIFAVISIVVVNTLITSTRSFALTRTNRVISQSGIFVMDRITREIRNASDLVLVESVFNQSPGALTLLGADGVSEISFEMNDNDILFYEDGELVGSVLGNDVLAESLIFRNISTPSLSAVKIELTLSAGGVNSKSVNFYNTIILRGSYE